MVVWKAEIRDGRIRKRSPKSSKKDVKRNPDRFPLDSVLQLTIKQSLTLRSSGSRSQIVTLSWYWQAKLDSYDHSL